MAAINDLLRQITDATLRGRLEQEFARLSKNKKFGLVFEEHIPECTPLYGVGIKRGSTVARKTGQINDVLAVLKINGDVARCRNKVTGEIEEILLTELVAVALFGEAIFPALQPIDSVENAPDTFLWHTLIEADNYHALQLLEYLYPKKVDCIYIDPPYNTGARDWKYNNDYVDGTDSWRHSKWLSMMQKRLKIAKRILAPDGVMAISIDHNELAHLICLIETSELFESHEHTIVTVVHNPRGNITNNFARTNEYIIFITPKSMHRLSRATSENSSPRKLRRWGHFSLRTERRTMFYPVYVKDNKIVRIGQQPPDDFHPESRNIQIGDEIEIWPIDQNGIERRWNYAQSEISSHLERIVVLPKDDGVDLFLTSQPSPIKTVWVTPELDAGGIYGSKLVEKLAEDKFPFPKSLYTVYSAIKPIVQANPNALILDFFAGSGTALHAVNLINAEDDGNRRCIVVTNNEVAETEAKALTKKGVQPGDLDWEAKGICQSITWPRTKNSIFGVATDGSPLTGEYVPDSVGEKRPMSEGFLANVEYFKLGFLDKTSVSLGQQFREILPLLWLKSGAVGKRPEIDTDVEPDMLILPENGFAILVDETRYAEFAERLAEQESVNTIYFVTNSEDAFREMSADVKAKNTYQLYRDYIDNFVLGARRDSL